jgi:uncharacterized protein with NRDE domain
VRGLSPAFVRTALFGTRASTVLLIERTGAITVAEKSWPGGDLCEFALPASRSG